MDEQVRVDGGKREVGVDTGMPRLYSSGSQWSYDWVMTSNYLWQLRMSLSAFLGLETGYDDAYEEYAARCLLLAATHCV